MNEILMHPDARRPKNRLQTRPTQGRVALRSRQLLPSLWGVLAVTLGVVALWGTGCTWVAPTMWVDHYQEYRPSEFVDSFAGGSEFLSLRCTTHNGSITVLGTDRDDIVFKVRKRAGGIDEADAERCSQAVEILHYVDGDEFVLGWRWSESRKAHWSVGVAFDIEMPRTLAAKLKTHNGPVTVTGVEGEIAVTTHNGALDVADCQHRVVARTHNGSIEIRGRSREFQLQTHNGSILFENDCPGEISGRVRTHNGQVRIALDPSAQARLVCRTHNGSLSVPSDVVITQRDKHQLRGLLYGGEEQSVPGGELDLRTHNGSISVQ